MKFFSKSKKKEEREETLDIKHYTYLKEDYQKEIMFNTFNHPKNELLLHVLSQIYAKLSLDTANMRIPTAPLLGNVQTGIYPSIQAFCDTAKIPPKEVSQNYYKMKWKVFKEELELNFMIDAYYRYHDAHKAEIKGWIEFNLVNTEDEIERMILENFNTLSS